MRSKLNISAFPARLKARRKEKKLTQQELSVRTGISVKTINTWETTDLKEGSGPKVSNIIALCEALECDFEYLFGGIDTPIRDYVDIHKETGIPVEAVKELCERHRSYGLKNDSFLEILSAIIVYGFHIGYCYDEYKKAASEYENRNEYYNQMKQQCDRIEMSKKEFCELLMTNIKESEFKMLLEISKTMQRGYSYGKHKENRGQDRRQLQDHRHQGPGPGGEADQAL